MLETSPHPQFNTKCKRDCLHLNLEQRFKDGQVKRKALLLNVTRPHRYFHSRDLSLKI